jgi:signal transduction histidine kinase
VAFETAVDPKVVLRLDRSALDLILSNLIRNALAHTDSGRIEVGFRDRTLTIADTGRGIEAEDLPHVFRRFYRGAASPPRGEGFGLGLALVKRLCDLYAWEVALDSGPGKGTRVTIAFPPEVVSSQ